MIATEQTSSMPELTTGATIRAFNRMKQVQPELKGIGIKDFTKAVNEQTGKNLMPEVSSDSELLAKAADARDWLNNVIVGCWIRLLN